MIMVGDGSSASERLLAGCGLYQKNVEVGSNRAGHSITIVALRRHLILSSECHLEKNIIKTRVVPFAVNIPLFTG